MVKRLAATRSRCHLAARTALAIPTGIRIHPTASTPDGADHALSALAEATTATTLGYATTFILSGDHHHFIAVARRAHLSAGSCVWVVAIEGSLSRTLAAAADRITLIRPTSAKITIVREVAA